MNWGNLGRVRRVRTTGLAAIALACVGFVPPKLARELEIAGEYDVEGTHPDGSGYVGTGTIARLGGDRYQITFRMPNGVFRAICVRSRDVLGCGWGSGQLGAALYRASSGRLDGRWFRDGDDALGVDVVSMPDLEDSGSFALEGAAPDGSPHQGSFTIADWGAKGQTPGVRRLHGTRSGVAWTGWGVTDGKLLAVGFPAERCGAALYRIDGNGVITAIWMDRMTPGVGLGKETLVRNGA